MQTWPNRVLFTYWGRRGALSRFTFELGRTALANSKLATTISISHQNESFARYREFGAALFPIDTFETGLGALTQAWRIPSIRRTITARLIQDRIQAVIELMPHVWSPLVMPIVKNIGVHYTTIIHDADGHPGDLSAWAKRWGDQTLHDANLVLTLSQAVSDRLIATGRVPRSRLRKLFHPDLTYGAFTPHEPPRLGEPLRLLFFGRLMAYKGLSLFLDMIELLRQDGIPVQVGVFGEGALGTTAERLTAIGAEVVNRWIEESEIQTIFSRFHAIVLGHTEASQSGVAAVAFGVGLPVIATPVGGLVEQVKDGITGVLAARADAAALTQAVKRLLLDPIFYRSVCQHIAQSKNERSMTKFVAACLDAVGASRRQRSD